MCAGKEYVDGYVCSPHEILTVKEYGKKIITPGIRLATDSKDDQQRIMTPLAAFQAGAQHIVMGRSILKAKDPLEKIQMIYQSISQIS